MGGGYLGNKVTTGKPNVKPDGGSVPNKDVAISGGKGNSTDSKLPSNTAPHLGEIVPKGYNIEANKFDYFFGKVTTGNPHNIQRSAQNLKDLNALGIKTEHQLVSVFNKAASDGVVVSQKNNNFGTTITKSITVSDKGSIQVSFFYTDGNLNTKPKITTLIPKLSGSNK